MWKHGGDKKPYLSGSFKVICFKRQCLQGLNCFALFFLFIRHTAVKFMERFFFSISSFRCRRQVFSLFFETLY